MYQPRRVADVTDTLERPEPESCAEAFRSAPRRSVRTRSQLVRTRFAPAAVSVALLATSGAFALNLKASEQPTAAVPAPERDEAVTRSASRLIATPDATATPSQGAEAFVAAAWSDSFGKDAGVKFSQGALTVRAQASDESASLGSLKQGEKVSITDKVVSGFRQIAFNGKVGYVLNAQLGAKASPVKAKSDTYTGNGEYSGPSVLGLKPRAMVVYNAVTAKWSFSSIGGYRASSRSNHQFGGAIDFMTFSDTAKGRAVADYLVQNAAAFKVDHIIYQQKIWTPYRPFWRPMADRGSPTQNHMDHVHVSVKL